jgi:hypothetical protein
MLQKIGLNNDTVKALQTKLGLPADGYSGTFLPHVFGTHPR